jgi:hypothetical protein
VISKYTEYNLILEVFEEGWGTGRGGPFFKKALPSA